ncbi:hypothetical protein LPW41_11660 [Microbacterium sp. JC 701]|uniref:hypothetical protein n=1 Tax=Microbacterium sp. JC 701 TaxID=2897389 RepID=UPI001E3A92AA|nr:hypothetical protein [Microbacterium sp. JC 701]MCD2170353.1 hypothetical protein [Microbacterium sp. JC 701]
MDPAAQELTRNVLLILGGVLGAELFKSLRDGITGSMRRRRAEVDRIAREKAATEDEIHDLETWNRIVTEHAHAVRVVAIQAGLPVPEFPARPPGKKK